jgi:hypothetical protein
MKKPVRKPNPHPPGPLEIVLDARHILEETDASVLEIIVAQAQRKRLYVRLRKIDEPRKL